MVVKAFFLSSVYFSTICSFWLMETNFLTSRNHFVLISQITFHWKQFFRFVQKNFEQIFYYSQWKLIFSLVETIFFHSYFLETIIVIRRRAIFKKILFLQVKTVFFNVFTCWLESSHFFGPLKPYFSKSPLLSLVQTEFW